MQPDPSSRPRGRRPARRAVRARRDVAFALAAAVAVDAAAAVVLVAALAGADVALADPGGRRPDRQELRDQLRGARPPGQGGAPPGNGAWQGRGDDAGHWPPAPPPAGQERPRLSPDERDALRRQLREQARHRDGR